MTIGIIGAMDEEVELLRDKIENKQEETIANCHFISGNLYDKPVVLLKSGIGKVNAAMAATIMHERYQPSIVINTGSAGGFLIDAAIGDIVISQEVVHHDVDVTAFDYTYGQVPNMPASFQADKTLITITKQAADDIGMKSIEGLIATGDSFMDNPERVAFVRKKFPAMVAAEMEAAAIAQVCYQYDKPFVIIRSLSDIAGKESSISFDSYLKKAATNAAMLIMKMIQKL